MAGPGVDFYCSRLSVDVRERIFGTASRVDVWLLLEYNDRWSRDLLADSELPAEVKGAISGVLRSVPRSRIVFVKNDLRGAAGLSFFVAITRERQRALYRFQLDDYRDLLSIDVLPLVRDVPPARASSTPRSGRRSGRGRPHVPGRPHVLGVGRRQRTIGEATDEQHASPGPLYLVCLDGKHDKCCAKFGLPVYRAMLRCTGDAVWQSSHVGGDRFAANLVCLPSGIYYGHLTPEDVPRLVEDHAAGRVYLDKYRGQSCYSFDIQAAEYFARVATGLDSADAFTLRDVSRSDGLIRVRLDEVGTDQVHALEVASSAAFHHYLSCDSALPSDVPQYALRSYRVDHGPPAE